MFFKQFDKNVTVIFNLPQLGQIFSKTLGRQKMYVIQKKCKSNAFTDESKTFLLLMVVDYPHRCALFAKAISYNCDHPQAAAALPHFPTTNSKHMSPSLSFHSTIRHVLAGCCLTLCFINKHALVHRVPENRTVGGCCRHRHRHRRRHLVNVLRHKFCCAGMHRITYEYRWGRR